MIEPVFPAVPAPTLKSPARPVILILDDSDMVRSFLRSMMSAEPLCARVVEAENGAEGLERIHEEDFDCVISDLDMPVMDGMEFLRAVRRRYNRIELPVLLLTSANGLSQKVEGFRAGASDYIIKSGAAEELLARVETHVNLKRLHRRLRRLAYTDELTGLGNRRWFIERIEAELNRARRKEWQLSLLILDVDHFKSINDEHGHLVGDAVLAQLAQVVRTGSRGYDAIARVGGEEFAVLLPGVAAAKARSVAERMRHAVEMAAIGGMAPRAVTISIGAATGPSGARETWSSLFRRADHCLYQAKDSGRNRVIGPAE